MWDLVLPILRSCACGFPARSPIAWLMALAGYIPALYIFKQCGKAGDNIGMLLVDVMELLWIGCEIAELTLGASGLRLDGPGSAKSMLSKVSNLLPCGDELMMKRRWYEEVRICCARRKCRMKATVAFSDAGDIATATRAEVSFCRASFRFSNLTVAPKAPSHLLIAGTSPGHPGIRPFVSGLGNRLKDDHRRKLWSAFIQARWHIRLSIRFITLYKRSTIV